MTCVRATTLMHMAYTNSMTEEKSNSINVSLHSLGRAYEVVDPTKDEKEVNYSKYWGDNVND